ncbi:MAG: glycoside hydrolase family 57 protein [Nitrospiraceae bacterium]
MKHGAVCFFWHMHQPYYTDPVTRSASMPWVRLHATKAYYDMAFQLDRYPAVAATFNFTPSLLLQLEECAAGSVTDIFLEHTRKPAGDLSASERAFVVRHFFAANWGTMVRPYPRYRELLDKRGAHVRPGELERTAQRFSVQDVTDLQVWHNLAWFGYGAVARLPQLAELRTKGRQFTEADKQTVLDAQITIMREVIPLYRTLLERGQIELTTTPFYHPILPLVMDMEYARRALPHLPPLPNLHAPADAEAHLRKAVAAHHQWFGQPPQGLWPSEGSVCPEMLPLVRAAGLRWFATDEGNLQRSLSMQHDGWDRLGMLYRPYRVGADGQELSVVFRDRDLSDAFGFHYHKSHGPPAVDDAIRRFHEIVEQGYGTDALIPVILDGENPWEHYYQGGEEFLTLLYQRLTREAEATNASTRLTTSTMGRAIEAFPHPGRLHQLHTGSWINSDFGIWIGHDEDRRAWELLAHTRQRLVDVAPTLPKEQAETAWEELYAAEGSDWFWWYGDEFETDFKSEFDRLFRTHLRNVWLRAGLVPPDYLNRPLIDAPAAPVQDVVGLPQNLLRPTLDGMQTDFFEWYGAGSIRAAAPLGAMWTSGRHFSRIAYGFSLESLFLRLDPDLTLVDCPGPLTVEWEIATDGHVYKVTFPLLPAETTPCLLSKGAPGETFVPHGEIQTIARRSIIEVAVPFARLDARPGDTLRFSVVVTRDGMEQGRYPTVEPVAVQVPDEDFDAKMWRV